MADDLQALEDWVAPLIKQLEPKARRRLTKAVALDLRRSQRERIKAQQNPDGSPFEPRKPQHRAKQGSIRRKAMFTKLRTAKYLKAKSTADSFEVGFVGRAAHIARIHQLGLRAKVDRNGPQYDYPQRQIIGFTDTDRALIQDSLLHHLEEV